MVIIWHTGECSLYLKLVLESGTLYPVCTKYYRDYFTCSQIYWGGTVLYSKAAVLSSINGLLGFREKKDLVYYVHWDEILYAIKKC